MADADVIPLDDHRDDHDPRPGRVPPRTSSASGKPSTDEPSTDQPSADEPSADQRAAEQAATDWDDRGRDDRPNATEFVRLVNELGRAGRRLVARLAGSPIEQLRAQAADPLREILAAAERLGVDWSGSVEELAEFARSRTTGDYAVDEFGFDPQFTTTVVLPVLRQLAAHWFRVEVRGAENIPSEGAALLVANHAGVLPIDALVLQSVIFDEVERHARCLGADLVFTTPYAGNFARKIGVTLACQEDAERLLGRGDLVTVFPEGFKGLGKPYSERYKLQRFGRGGFVSAAVRAQVPIVPISIVGSEDIYPQIAQMPILARILGVPYFPVTPLFPLLGPLGLIPLPTKWIIRFGEQIATDELSTAAADDPMVVFNVTDQVRETIQQALYQLLAERRSVFG